MGGQLVGIVDQALQRESQAGNDSLVQAPAIERGTSGDSACLAQLHEREEREGPRKSNAGYGERDVGSAVGNQRTVGKADIQDPV